MSIPAFAYLRQYSVASGSSTQLTSNAQQAQVENLGTATVYLVNESDPASGTFSEATWYPLAPGEAFGYELPSAAGEFVILAQCAPGESTLVSVFAYPA